MDKKTVLLKLDQINDYPPGTLTGIEDTAHWDSMTWLSIIALADEEFKKPVKFEQLVSTRVVDDVVSLLI